MIQKDSKIVKLAIPKGRMQEGAVTLLADAGIRIRKTVRGYRPKVSLENYEAKILKPQNIVEMLWLGSRDVGFTGADWVAELGADLDDLVEQPLDILGLRARRDVVVVRLAAQHLVTNAAADEVGFEACLAQPLDDANRRVTKSHLSSPRFRDAIAA